MPSSALPVKYVHPVDRNVVVGNLLLGLLTGSPERVLGGIGGGLFLRRMHENPGTIGAYLRGLTGGSEHVSPVIGTAAGHLVGRAMEDEDARKRNRGLLRYISGKSPIDVYKNAQAQGDAPDGSTESAQLKKESSMNTVEELFKTATEALEEKVFIPTVLAKLATRGYKAETQEEAIELLKHAQVVRQGIASGEMAPIPMSQLDEKGQITKAAADAANQDFLAFAPEVEVDLGKCEPVVKEAAEVLAWGFMQSVKEHQATEAK